jgi:putative transcriptional regulator
VRDIKAGKGKRVKVTIPAAAEARPRVAVSQAEFARLLGVSVRTLHD